MRMLPNDSYQTIVPPSYWETSAEGKVFNELDCGRLLPQVSNLLENLTDDAYSDLNIVIADVIKDRCLGGRDLGDNLNIAVDGFIQELAKHL